MPFGKNDRQIRLVLLGCKCVMKIMRPIWTVSRDSLRIAALTTGKIKYEQFNGWDLYKIQLLTKFLKFHFWEQQIKISSSFKFISR